MNKREIAKQRTKEKILRTAELLFISNGIDGTRTAEIAKRCGIAHGTVFVHFPNKETLVSAVFVSRLRKSAIELEERYRREGSITDLLKVFLDHIYRHEHFFALYFRALPSFNTELKRKIMSFEIAVRDNIHRALSDAKVDPKQIPAVLNVLFGQLLYYYSFKEVLCEPAGVIETYRGEIQRTILKLILPDKTHS